MCLFTLLLLKFHQKYKVPSTQRTIFAWYNYFSTWKKKILCRINGITEQGDNMMTLNKAYGGNNRHWLHVLQQDGAKFRYYSLGLPSEYKVRILLLWKAEVLQLRVSGSFERKQTFVSGTFGRGKKPLDGGGNSSSCTHKAIF